MGISLLRESRGQMSDAMSFSRVVLWGTPDFGKPRTRILVNGLRKEGAFVAECTADIWDGVEDKSQLSGITARLNILWRYLLTYPRLVWRYLRSPRHDAVFVAYMGHFDVLILWPFAKLRGSRIVWDAFLSLYDTVVDDRRLIQAQGLAAKALRAMEWLSCKAADTIILDTEAHAAYFCERYGLNREKVFSVWVGAETNIFSPAQKDALNKRSDEFTVLFYGQYIPLHGVEHILSAIDQISDDAIKWVLVGSGQERAKADAMIAGIASKSLTLIDWVEYADLPALIASADVCLGVFGGTDKAARVIPNKVFQVLGMGAPLITADTGAIREILNENMPGVWLVPPESGSAIAAAVADAKLCLPNLNKHVFHAALRSEISPSAVVKSLLSKVRSLHGEESLTQYRPPASIIKA